MPENMKCPFRQDEHGEFRDCIGKSCMAYFEFESYPYDPAVDRATNIREPRAVSVPMCRRMPQPLTYGGCAI